jgi:hypothetical protein
MAGVLQHLRSSTLNKRPNPASMVDGQIAINYASGSPGAFFKDTNGNLVKVGPVHVGATAPNVSPASGGTAGNSLGEQWLDTSGGTYVFKIWDGAAWRSEAGEFVNSTGDTMTGSLTMGPSANLIFEGSTDDGFETTLTVVDPTADRTITLPNVSGTVVTTGDSGTVTSTMIADGTIVNADVNASAAIAGTKISPDFGSQTIQTTGVFSHAVGSAGAPTITFTGDTNTGIYSPGADQLAISTGGSGRLFVDASGNVGVGTASPAFPLQIGATGAGGIAIDATNSAIHGTFGSGGNVTLRAQAAASSGGGDIFLGGSTRGDANVNSIVFSTANTVRAKIDSSGYFTVSSNRINGFEFNDTSAAIYHSFGSGGGLALRAQTTATAGGGEIFLGGSSRGDGNVNAIVFSNANTERARIDSSGRLLVGTSSARSNFYNSSSYSPRLQLESANDGASSSIALISVSGGGFDEPNLVFAKSRGSAIGNNTIVASGDDIGNISFQASDGSEFVVAANILAEVDGTPGANDMPGRLVFSTTADGASSPTERMRIGANGAVAIGSTNTATGALVFIDTANGLRINGWGAGIGVGCVMETSVSTASTAIGFTYSGTDVGSISTTSTSTSFNTSSDYRLKENVTAVTDGIARLQQLKPSRFNFIADPAKTVDGFIAHEVQVVVPEAITGEKDAVDDEGKPIYQGIDQSKLVPLLTAALQESVAKIESLEARLTAAGI